MNRHDPITPAVSMHPAARRRDGHPDGIPTSPFRAVLCAFAFSLALLAGLPSFAAAAAPAVAATYSAEQVQADFRQLYQTLQAAHFDLYARRSKADYDALYESMLGGFDQPMSRDEVEIAFQQFVAFGRVAHARIDGLQSRYEAYRQQGGRGLPLQIRVQNGAVWVAENYSGLAEIKRGDRILSLNGFAIDKLMEQLSVHLSADNDYLLHTLYELWFPALIWQQFGPLDHFDLQIQRGDSAPFAVRVPARTRSEAQQADAGQPAMLALDWDKREARHVSHGNATIGYLRPGPFFNNEPGATDVWDRQPFARFIDETFTILNKDGVGAVLIDLRDNPGGDNSFSDQMVSWFASKPYRFASDFRIRVSDATTASNAKRLSDSPAASGDISIEYAALYRRQKPGDIVSFPFPLTEPRSAPRYQGKVFLLINRRSYSNAVMVAAIAQDYGFATVLGEETSDLATTYGAMEQFTLTHTGLAVGYPKAHIIRPSGDLSARGVQPDWPIATPVLEGPDDPVLQQALRLISESLTR